MHQRVVPACILSANAQGLVVNSLSKCLGFSHGKKIVQSSCGRLTDSLTINALADNFCKKVSELTKCQGQHVSESPGAQTVLTRC